MDSDERGWGSERNGLLGMGDPGNVSKGGRKLRPGDCRRFEAAQSKLKLLHLAEGDR